MAPPSSDDDLSIFPATARRLNGHLWLGGLDLVDLAREYGTPLHIFDEATLVDAMRSFRQAFATRYPSVLLAYAAKAFINPWLARLLAREGLGMDVVSAGEMAVAHDAGFPMERVHLHGNNKLQAELEMALELGVGRVVIDNAGEIGQLNQLASARGLVAPVLLRVAPGVEAHTHQYLQTGGHYSKFGIPLQGEQASRAVREIVASSSLRLVGYHAHIGSQIFDLLPYRDNVARLVEFAADMRQQCGVEPLELSPGGGWGVQHTPEEDPPSVEDVAIAITNALQRAASAHGLPLPRLILEPGRSIVGRAGVTLYTVGSIKDVPGFGTYAAVDGGMADNIRPALYQADYTAVAANRVDDEATDTQTIAGKYCETGDILIPRARLPRLRTGDLLAVPATGAYAIPMASNYNLALKPAIVAVLDGRAVLVRRRQTYADLVACEVR